MNIAKLTTLLVVDDIESKLPVWERLGYRPTVRVPEEGTLAFAIFAGPPGELMMQTRESLADDLPDVAALKPSSLFYAHVDTLAGAAEALPGARCLVRERKTFYGATEAWYALPGDNTVIGLAIPPAQR